MQVWNLVLIFGVISALKHKGSNIDACENAYKSIPESYQLVHNFILDSLTEDPFHNPINSENFINMYVIQFPERYTNVKTGVEALKMMYKCRKAYPKNPEVVRMLFWQLPMFTDEKMIKEVREGLTNDEKEWYDKIIKRKAFRKIRPKME